MLHMFYPVSYTHLDVYKRQVIHVSGMIINIDNIDQLLMSRYISAKQRRAQKHLKGPSKRTLEIKNKFLNTLENLLENKDII